MDEVLQWTPRDLATLSNRGYAHRKLGQYALAVDDYARAIAVSPDSVRLYNNRGYCCAKLGRCVRVRVGVRARVRQRTQATPRTDSREARRAQP